MVKGLMIMMMSNYSRNKKKIYKVGKGIEAVNCQLLLRISPKSTKLLIHLNNRWSLARC